ncbi:hypothetical protein AMTRI_Chr03g48920 [Amborella trichopoda]|uniref:Uncharacterized protein n=1 Tax=Amborella trichopoda TaxID=13333 RepID=W1P4M9_AMBTC|nr:hypothetical protein AMTR_s00083p00168790 [Amborella trichopoda]
MRQKQDHELDHASRFRVARCGGEQGMSADGDHGSDRPCAGHGGMDHSAHMAAGMDARSGIEKGKAVDGDQGSGGEQGIAADGDQGSGDHRTAAGRSGARTSAGRVARSGGEHGNVAGHGGDDVHGVGRKIISGGDQGCMSIAAAKASGAAGDKYADHLLDVAANQIGANQFFAANQSGPAGKKSEASVKLAAARVGECVGVVA